MQPIKETAIGEVVNMETEEQRKSLKKLFTTVNAETFAKTRTQLLSLVIAWEHVIHAKNLFDKRKKLPADLSANDIEAFCLCMKIIPRRIRLGLSFLPSAGDTDAESSAHDSDSSHTMDHEEPKRAQTIKQRKGKQMKAESDFDDTEDGSGDDNESVSEIESEEEDVSQGRKKRRVESTQQVTNYKEPKKSSHNPIGERKIENSGPLLPKKKKRSNLE